MFKSDKLKQEIKSHNVSYAELDRRIGLGGKGVTSKYVNGVYDPKPTMLVKFLTALGWSDEQLQQTKLSDWYDFSLTTEQPINPAPPLVRPLA